MGYEHISCLVSKSKIFIKSPSFKFQLRGLVEILQNERASKYFASYNSRILNNKIKLIQLCAQFWSYRLMCPEKFHHWYRYWIISDRRFFSLIVITFASSEFVGMSCSNTDYPQVYSKSSSRKRLIRRDLFRNLSAAQQVRFMYQ